MAATPHPRDGVGNGLIVAVPAVLAMTAFVTWPQITSMSTTFAAHVDSYFSTWRLMWIAHALRTDPRHLFDANIFYPTRSTLAYSDATLLQGLLGTPLLWAGLSPVLTYNLLLLCGFVGSGLGAFVLVKYLAGRTDAALVSAAVFTMAPYRVEHFMHLEMQWAMWIPLTFWALHRTVDDGSWRFGALSGVFFALQALSCVYYSVFLAMALAIVVPALLVRAPSRARGAVLPLLLGAAIAAALSVPYALVYIRNAQTVGERPLSDLLALSATPMNYLAAPGANRWWGWTSDIWGSNERRLFPGVVAIALAGAALLGRSRRNVWTYLLLVIVGVELSFGVNGVVYGWLFDHVQGLRGLRSPARLGIVVQCAIAVLAGLGVGAIVQRASESHEAHAGGGRHLLAGFGFMALLLVTIESANRGMALAPVSAPDASDHDVYSALRSRGPGVVLELPVPRLSALPGNDAMYAFRSAAHWYPLVNGYSGYYPQVYAETMHVMERFPDEESVARLQRLDVRYLIVHRELIPPEEYTRLLIALAEDKRMTPLGVFRTKRSEDALFLLESR